MRANRGRGRAIAIAACLVPPLAALAVYVANPFGARSFDPRERVLGVNLYRVPSGAMAPTLQPGTVIVVHAGDAVVRDLHRGDVIVFEPPAAPGQAWVKRVIGMPGDTVELQAGRLRVNGRAVAEPYVDPRRASTPYSRDFAAVRVPRDRVFVLGDNRDNSEDSRVWGFAALARVRGRVAMP